MDKRHSYTETLIHSQCISGIVRTKFMKESQKRASADTRKDIDRGSSLLIEINLYSDISGVWSLDRKTYGATLHLCSEGRKSAIFDLYPDRFWLCPERLEK